ncbi:MAG: OsmC family protein [Alphaproteobacteria bacterium]|nr:OsmC family protein [Alphaproteobacteria bacterium]
MSITIKTKYLGELRTESVHVKSGSQLITDAPLDNEGKGEAFSPTDLLTTSLATCMITVMGIAANQCKLRIDDLKCDVTKIMTTNPRKIAEVIIELNFAPNDFSKEQRQILQDAAYSCPVALSLHPDLKKTVSFNF